MSVSAHFLGLPPCALRDADAVIVPLPFERTVSYGVGTRNGPAAILEASTQLEAFDEETDVDFAKGPRIHVLPPLRDDRRRSVEQYLELVRARVAELRPRFVLGLGGEHLVTYGLVRGLAPDPRDLTIVHIDAHGDVADRLRV